MKYTFEKNIKCKVVFQIVIFYLQVKELDINKYKFRLEAKIMNVRRDTAFARSV